MKCKIRIVESVSRYEKQLNRRLSEGRLDKMDDGIIMTPETFSKVFSPERIKLLRRIYKNKIKSIYQLAKELDKPYEVVFRNIKFLEGIGIINIVEKDKRKIPHIDHRFSIDMFTDEGVEA